MTRKHLRIAYSVALSLCAVAAVVAVGKGTDTAHAGGDPTTPYARVTLTTASGGGDSTSFIALDFEFKATSLGERHEYGLFSVGRFLEPDPKLVGNFVANTQFASVQVDVLSPEGAKLAGYRLADATIGALEHSLTNGSLVVEQAGFSFSSIEYEGFGPGAIRDLNVGR